MMKKRFENNSNVHTYAYTYSVYVLHRRRRETETYSNGFGDFSVGRERLAKQQPSLVSWPFGYACVCVSSLQLGEQAPLSAIMLCKGSKINEHMIVSQNEQGVMVSVGHRAEAKVCTLVYTAMGTHVKASK